MDIEKKSPADNEPESLTKAKRRKLLAANHGSKGGKRPQDLTEGLIDGIEDGSGVVQIRFCL